MNTKFVELNKRVDAGLIRKVETDKLVLYNYTDKTTYEKAWDEFTLNARGTIYEKETGKTVATSFPKFFNYGELTEDKRASLLNETEFDAYTKIDGSLGILYYYDGRWRVNTRGSFNSDQAIKAESMLHKYDLSDEWIGFTFLIEIIYPQNRIIVDYGQDESLILIGVYNPDGHDEITSPTILNAWAKELVMEAAPVFRCTSILDLITLQKTVPKDEEGWVVRFKSGFRCKFKGDEYMKIARILSKCTPLEFWRNMSEGKVCKQLLLSLPEEIRDEVDGIRAALESKYEDVHSAMRAEFNSVREVVVSSENPRKTLGLMLKSLKFGKIMFAFLDDNQEKIEYSIMRAIKPKGNVL